MKTDQLLPFNLILETIGDPHLRSVCEQLKHYPEFWSWPAAISHHHAYEGGLIAHTLEVAYIALNTAAKFPQVNRDVLLAAALWHDWGKTLEYQIEDWSHSGASERPRHLTRNNDATGWNVWTYNRAASTHIATSAIEFSKHCDNAAVVHAILAHHGPVREWGSPEAPRTLEALILHQADMLSASYGATK